MNKRGHGCQINIGQEDNVRRLLLEKPIVSPDDDFFGIMPYTDLLIDAIEQGATFIAIDGVHGSGKSSLVNMLTNRYGSRDNSVGITFLDIKNEVGGELQSEKDLESAYNRIFVSQVADRLCHDPYKTERLFYREVTSYSVLHPIRNRFWSLVVDFLLSLATASFLFATILGSSLFKGVPLLAEISNFLGQFVPILASILLALVLVKGFGIYKPKHQEQSPMLNIDRCRLIYRKIIYSYAGGRRAFSQTLSRKTRNRKEKLFIIIDELDRVSPETQASIIKLLYNEYRPLQFEHVTPVFIFMIDTKRLDEGLNRANHRDDIKRGEDEGDKDNQNLVPKGLEVSSNKLFDYILPVSNNQQFILRHALNKLIERSATLTDIFGKDNDYAEYFKGLLCREYRSLRELKHILNKIITKYEYLRRNEVNPRCELLIATVVLCDKLGDKEASDAISSTLSRQNRSGDSPDDEEKCSLIKEFYHLDFIKPDYYIYIYNFVDKDDLLTVGENRIYEILYRPKQEITTADISEAIELVNQENENRFQKIYDEIFSGLSEDLKVIFLGSEPFFDFLYKNNAPSVEKLLKNLYKNPFFMQICVNLKVFNIGDRANMILEFIKSAFFFSVDGTEEQLSACKRELNVLLQNTGDYALEFSLQEFFSKVIIDDEIFELLRSTKVNGATLLFILLERGDIECKQVIDRIDAKIIDEILAPSNAPIAQHLLAKLIQEERLQPQATVRLISTSPDRYGNFEGICKKIDGEVILTLDILQKILKKYGYNPMLDEHIIHNLNESPRETTNLLKDNRFEISQRITDCLAALPGHFPFNSYYEKIFIKAQHFELYIWSKVLRTERFELEKRFQDNPSYTEAMMLVYGGLKDERFSITDDTKKFLFQNFDWAEIAQGDNYRKIFAVIPKEPADVSNLFGLLTNIGRQETFCSSAASQHAAPLWFLKHLRAYADEQQVSSTCKANLSKRINRLKVENETK